MYVIKSWGKGERGRGERKEEEKERGSLWISRFFMLLLPFFGLSTIAPPKPPWTTSTIMLWVL